MPEREKATVGIPEQTPLASKLKKLPKQPGIYKYFNEKGELLYVGKAKDLRARVRNYFQENADLSPKTRKLVEKIRDLEWTCTRSEVEALVLEANLIREEKPPFNILLRDDKSFLYIKITNDPFPAVYLTRRLERDGSDWFGPYVKAGQARKTLDFLREVLRFRNCYVEISPEGKAGKNPENRKIPCLDYQIRRCDAPCDARISLTEYNRNIRQLKDFLRGKTAPIRRFLQEEMMNAAGNKEFERAARFRDLLRFVEMLDATQSASIPMDFDADVIGMSYGKEKSFFHVLSVRHGKVVRSENFSLVSGETELETLLVFLRDHVAFFPDAPGNILVSSIFPSTKKNLWEEYIASVTGKKSIISIPERGAKRDLLHFAEKNAKLQAVNSRASFEKTDPLGALQEALHLPHRPERIECFDISHLSGTFPVASQVVFLDGKPEKKHYRKYHIKSLPSGKIDDFAAMAEVLKRRLSRLNREQESLQMEEFSSDPSPADSQAAEADNKDNNAMSKEMMFRFKRSTEETIAGYAGIKFLDGLAVIESVSTTPEHALDDTATEIIKTLVINSEEKCLRIFVSRKQMRFLLALKSLGFTEDKKPPKPFLAAQTEFEKENRKMTLLKIAPADLKRAAEETPGLIVIDGGKGQLSAVTEVLKLLDLEDKIPVCALAKREEEIFIPSQQSPLPIAADSPESKLLQQIRDEAHRFAISFNKNLRQKAETTSVLDSIEGIGEKSRQKLLRHYGSAESVMSASEEELSSIIPKSVVKNLRIKKTENT